MPERFLNLSPGDRREIIEAQAAVLHRSPVLVEKDVWVCWVLEHLFAAPNRVPMTFKGGTSLSKVHGAIARFSEDVDITLDCRTLVEPFDPFAPGISGQKKKKHADRLNEAMVRHVQGVIEPHLRTELLGQFGSGCTVERPENESNKLRIRYESALAPATGYVQRNVLVEFGGRNSLEPSDSRVVRPYLAEVTSALEFPAPRVDVLSPERTFWEKATLIHVECSRDEFKPTKERYARHWYDVAQLSDHSIGRGAIKNRALLEDVIKYKKVFYNSGHANYDACLAGRLRLVPSAAMQNHLRADFEKMAGEGMFEGTPPRFEDVIERLRALELEINAAKPGDEAQTPA